VTTNAELRKAIREMAEELADGVVQVIATMSLEQLAAMTRRGGGAVGQSRFAGKDRASDRGSARAVAAKSPKKDGASKAKRTKPAKESSGGKANGAKANGAKASKSKSNGVGRAGPRKLNRRDGDKIEKLRQGVLSVLRESGDWMPARDIGHALGADVKADDLSFPINYLRERDLVEKVGDRSQARYRITEAGRAHSGSFVKASGDALEEIAPVVSVETAASE
jgi:hypothetical protein